ncbi:MAG: DUF1501 domain-containing protein [Pseudomonadales bacterium]
MSRFNRRSFLTHSGIALAASSQLGWLASNAHAGSGDDYCAMVCILLAGGADSFNMLLPYDQNRYDTYASVRSDLALSRDDVLPLNYSGTDNQQFAVHPALSETRRLFDSNELAFVANIGPLAEPTSRADFDNDAARLPLGLFSHADQIAVWQTANAGNRATTGFGGRVADLLGPSSNLGPISMNISLSGTNLFQTGLGVTGYAVDPGEGVRSVAGYDDGSEIFSTALDNMLAADYDSLFRRAYAARLRGAIDSGAELAAALAAAPALNTQFSAGGLSSALAQVARLISVRQMLGVCRQTFFITVGGWDHHDEVLNNQANMLPGIDQGLAEFHAALTELGLLDAVTTFTISDFGRTLTSNGRGSDHGWGGHNLIMGGGINGGQVFGQYPDLSPGGELDLGRGRYLPTTSVDEFYAELALWFGVAAGEVSQVLPNIERFYNPAVDAPPLGLFAT